MGILSSLLGKSYGKKALKKLEKDPEYQELKAKIKKLDKELEDNDEDFKKMEDELGIPDRFKI